MHLLLVFSLELATADTEISKPNTLLSDVGQTLLFDQYWTTNHHMHGLDFEISISTVVLSKNIT